MKLKKYTIFVTAIALCFIPTLSFGAGSSKKKKQISWPNFAWQNKVTVAEGAFFGGCAGFTFSRWLFPEINPLFPSAAGAIVGMG